MIYGSYVCDVLFRLSRARDLDIGFDPNFRHPTEDEVRNWIPQHQLPESPRTIQFTRCHDFTNPEAGGIPIFNTDFWQLHMDGQIYVAEPEQHRHTILNRDCMPPLLIVSDQVTNERARAGLDRMERYPMLHNVTTVNRLREVLT